MDKLQGLIHLPSAFQLVLDASKTDLTARELVWLCESAVLCSRGEIDTRTLPGEASYIAGGSYYVLDAARGLRDDQRLLQSVSAGGGRIKSLYPSGVRA